MLKSYPDRGWLCSVDRANIRTFWRRAIAFCILLLVVIYGALVGVGMSWWRLQGVPVRLTEVAWPGHWHRIAVLRSEAYVKQAQVALAAREVDVALVCLRTARELDGTNYRAGLMLAELLRLSQPTVSDASYRRLLQTHPENAETTARSWLPWLLAREEYSTVSFLASARLVTDHPGATGAWLRAYVFARSQRPDSSDEILLTATRLDPAVRRVLLLLDQSRNLDSSGARSLIYSHLTQSSTDALELYFAIRLLIKNGFPDDALIQLTAHRQKISSRDYLELRSRALVAGGRSIQLREEATHLLTEQSSDLVIELLCAQVLRSPDPGLRSRLLQVAMAKPPRRDPAGFRLEVALFCLAATGGETATTTAMITRLETAAGVPFGAADQVLPFLADEGDVSSPRNWLPLLQPLSLEIIYAWLERTAP